MSLSQNHFKKFYIMECVSNGYEFKSSKIVCKELSQEDLIHASKQNFCDLKKRLREETPVIGIFNTYNDLLGFGIVQSRGNIADYCYVRNCDFYFQDFFIYPQYRRQGVISEFFKVQLSKKGHYKLVVRSNNLGAIEAYKKAGLKIVDTKYGIRIYKDLFFPKFEL